MLKFTSIRGRLVVTKSCRLQLLACAFAAWRLLLPEGVSARAQDEFERTPINYTASTPQNAVSRLQERIRRGDLRLDFDDRWGYLRSLLRALSVPESSQTLVFSKTSFQRDRIAPRTPRALYYNDNVYVGYVAGGDVMEVSAVDPKLGTVFYTLDQQPTKRPRLVRQGDSCLSCHATAHNQGLPGQLLRSVYPDAEGFPILSSGSFRVDQTTPLENRWGGWYVTGTHGTQKHLGNLIVVDKQTPEQADNSAGMNVTSLKGRFDDSSYLTGHSDIVALLILEHQATAHNLIAAASFQTRTALYQEEALNRDLKQPAGYRWESTTSRIKAASEPLVKYLLLSEEAPLRGPIRGTSSFAADFANRGPRDKHGRSLRDLDLHRRLFKYPCSYLIYSPAFDALPAEVKSDVYQRMWNVLSGADTSPAFAHLTREDRRAILEILRETKEGLPDYWKSSAHAAVP